MYKVTFAQADGQAVSFDDITEIRTGKDKFSIKTVNENEILTYVFGPSDFYQLIGKDKNVIYHCQQISYLSISKTND